MLKKYSSFILRSSIMCGFLLVLRQKWVLGNSGNSNWNKTKQYFQDIEALVDFLELFESEEMNELLVADQIFQMELVQNSVIFNQVFGYW